MKWLGGGICRPVALNYGEMARGSQFVYPFKNRRINRVMAMKKELVPVEQRSIDFYGDDLTAVRADDNRIYAGLTQMCNALGIDAQGQRRRIERHAVLSKGLQGVDKLATPGGIQSGYVLRVDMVPLWLSGIRVSAIKEALRPKLERFQEEAATVLWEAFQEGRLTSDFALDNLLQSETPAAQAYRMASAIMKMARQQLLLEAQMETHTAQLVDHEQRLESIEDQLGGQDRHVTPDQAMQISQAVKTVAIAMGKKTKKNEFGAVYGELYRKFGITSYKMLPAGKFEDAMKFLTDWHQNIVGDDPF